MIYSICVFKSGVLHRQVYNLSSINLLKRTIVKELCLFSSKQILTELKEAKNITILANDYQVHAVKRDNVQCVIVTDKNFSPVDAKLIAVQSITCDDNLEEIIQKESKVVRIQQDLEDVRDILIKNIDKMNIRQKELEELVNKSEDLSLQTKIFARSSKNLNKCCLIM